MTNEERLQLVEKYIETFGRYSNPYKDLEDCKFCVAHDIDYSRYTQINKMHDFRVSVGSHIRVMNSAKHFDFNNDEIYISWDNGNVGAYQFTDSGKEYQAIQSIWKEFVEELRKTCLDYDSLNTHIVYDYKNGIEIIDKYEELYNEVREKLKAIRAEIRIEEAKAELEKALKEAQE